MFIIKVLILMVKKEGEHISYYLNGNVYYKGTYSDGKKVE